MSDGRVIDAACRVGDGLWSDEAPASIRPRTIWDDVADQFAEAGRVIAESLAAGIQGLTDTLSAIVDALGPRAYERLVPGDAIIVKPAKGGKTFFAWRGAKWVPVFRRFGCWVYAE